MKVNFDFVLFLPILLLIFLPESILRIELFIFCGNHFSLSASSNDNHPAANVSVCAGQEFCRIYTYARHMLQVLFSFDEFFISCNFPEIFVLI